MTEYNRLGDMDCYRDLNDLAERVSAKLTFATSDGAMKRFRKDTEGCEERLYFTTFRRKSDGRYTVFFFPSGSQIQLAINLVNISGGRVVAFRA